MISPNELGALLCAVVFGIGPADVACTVNVLRKLYALARQA
jgi:uncharacterized membrane protein YesL